ncbi:MAG: ABC transporter substrate-binding protein [Acholeplasma sp.]|nr:ABC transporter substrate-binding protein [Acholeplasma sp.]
MKKLVALIALVLVGTTLTGCGVVRSITCMNKEKLALFNWGEYIDPALIKAFEKENDVCVTMSTFDSNESAITKMKTQSFDLIIPSDYAVEQMVEEELLQTMDWSKITTFNRETDLASGLQSILDNVEFDILSYGVPYFWGNVGVLYNKDNVSLEILQAKEWEIFNEDLDIAFYDSSRDGFMVALKNLGYSMNTEEASELNEAENWLSDLARKDNVVFLTDEILDDMVKLSYDIALTYSGDAIYLMSEQEKLGFYVPTTGTNVWVDTMVIPKNAKNTDLAYAFINFMLTYDSQMANTEYVMYTTVRQDVYTELITEGSDFYEYVDAYNVVIHTNDEVYGYNAVTKTFMSDAWARIRVLS